MPARPRSSQKRCRPGKWERPPDLTLPAYGSSFILLLLAAPSWSRFCSLFRFAFPARTAVVLFADVFVQPGRIPIRMQGHGEILRPRRGENLRIVDRELIGKRLVVQPADVFHGAQRVAVHAVLVFVRVVVIVQAP